jgi:anaerobic selenocysteine-containing dehydrogenase
MIHRSRLLEQRIPRANIVINPVDAQRMSLTEGSMVKFSLNGSPVEAELQVNEKAPAGVALVPRSLGLPITSPALIELKV